MNKCPLKFVFFLLDKHYIQRVAVLNTSMTVGVDVENQSVLHKGISKSEGG